MKKNVNHPCGECGSTGRILTGEGKGGETCTECGGTGYNVVEMIFDPREGDRLRNKARRASLERFIILLSALSGAAVTYFYAWHQTTMEMVVLCFVGVAIASYLIMQLAPVRRLLQIVYDLVRIGLGFAVLVGALAGIGYIIHLMRSPP